MDLSNVPALAPPPGVVPNFVNPESLAPLCLTVIALTLPLMVLFLALRMYVRLRISRATGADDILCLLSAALVIIFCGITLSFLDNPVGPHQWDVPVSKLTLTFEKLLIVSVVMYALGCMAVKSTLLVLYLRIFSPHPRSRRMIYSGLSFIVVFYAISVIVALASCLPRAGDGGWRSTIRGQRCLREDSRFAEVQGVLGALTDIYVLIVPLTMISDLRLSRKRKFGVFGIFLTGSIACVVSIINAVYRFRNFQTRDALWNAAPIFALCAAELNIGIMCACMPVVFILLRVAASETISLAAKLRSWTTRNKTEIELPPYSNGKNTSLPMVPRGTMTGVKSFMQRFYRTNAGDSHMTSSQPADGEILTYVSADYDYHNHLVGGGTRVEDMSSSRHWKDSRPYASA